MYGVRYFMASIRKKVIGTQTYYYLEHPIRNGKVIEKKELYLGKDIPKNIEEIKKEFLNNIYKGKYYLVLNKIQKNYSKENKNIPNSVKEKELGTFAIKFTYDTQRIEGSKLTLRETANLLERGITPRNKPIGDVKEAETHKKVFYEMLNFKKDLSLQIVLYWHKLLFKETKTNLAGKIRDYQVGISGSRFMPPYVSELNILIKEFFSWFNQNKNKIHPVELAALVHLRFVTIHPFGDGNGRISRLIMNFILNKNKFPMLDILYNNRTSYYNALERSQINKKEYIFVQWFIKNYIKNNKRYLRI